MDNNRAQLLPSADLAEFYARKISTCLSLVYNYWDELSSNRNLILKINKELHEIFKMLKSRLERFDLKYMTKKYEDLDKKLKTIIPLRKEISKDRESGDRILKVKPTDKYNEYRLQVENKECIIWASLDCLGLLGKMDVKGRRIR